MILFLLVQVYVDGIIFKATNEILYEDFSKLMHTEFEMSMIGELKFFLKLQIKQTLKDIYIHQTKYVKDLLKKVNMDDAKEMKTPMYPTTYLRLDEESTKVDKAQYKAMIGSLLYLIVSRPNIMFSVCLCARFQKEPREVHLTVVKRIFRYLIGTSNVGLLFKTRESFRLTTTVMLIMLVIQLKEKSQVEVVTLFCGNLVTWICKKQGSTTLSTAKAEYISTTSYCTQLLWIKNQLEDHNIYEGKILIYCDNKVATSISKN